jgi:hypothetical protein
MTGKLLKTALHLDNLPFVYIQKVLAIPMLVFVVTFDSRRPLIYLPITKVRKTKVTTLSKIKKKGVENFISKEYRYTPPILIEHSNPIVNSSTLIVRRDIGAEYILHTQMYENLNCEVVNEYEKV